MSTTTTTSTDTGQHTNSRTTTSPTNTPATQLERSAAQRLRTTMAAVKLAFTWLGVRKTLAPEQRTTADPRQDFGAWTTDQCNPTLQGSMW
jgi:hypothetical protein